MPAPPPESEVAMDRAVTGRNRRTREGFFIEWRSYGRRRAPDDHARGRAPPEIRGGLFPRGPLDPPPARLRGHEGHRFEAEGIPVVMDAHAFKKLKGAVLEIDPDPAGEGYRLDHPDAVMTTFC